MTYNHFAFLYDDLMKNVPYQLWLDFVKRKTHKYKPDAALVLDLGCGTGELAIRLKGTGFQVIGVDLSGQMLTVANEKAMRQNQQIEFYQLSMAELTGFRNLDCVVCFCDSLNYLQTTKEVIQTFKGTFESLKEGGLFMFDVHSIYKMTEIFMNQTFTNNGDEISYIWNCFPGEYPNSVEHDLSFFVKTMGTKNQYERFDECHFQRTFSVMEYKGWLEDAGFTVIEINGDFEDNPVTDKTERIFFTARK